MDTMPMPAGGTMSMAWMPMPGGGAMSVAWMPMCGQGWGDAAASFLTMWTVMMVAMMLPSSIPLLWRYRHSLGRPGALPGALLIALVAAGYMLVWTLLGAAVYPLGAAITVVTMRFPMLARAVPIATGLVVLLAGALQFTRWKAHQLACCRPDRCRESPGCYRALPAGAVAALRHGLRLGVHCSQCCAGLTAVLLVTGIMDVPAMVAVAAGITLERLAPAGERIARFIGVLVVGAGLLLIAGAAGLP
jgi:predicted metal-binding membrane protein